MECGFDPSVYKSKNHTLYTFKRNATNRTFLLSSENKITLQLILTKQADLHGQLNKSITHRIRLINENTKMSKLKEISHRFFQRKLKTSLNHLVMLQFLQQ